MSQENVEIVRRTIVEVANRRDVDALDDLATADYEWHNARDLAGGRVHRGREAVLDVPAHDLDVLLRHRLLQQPGGFERLRSAGIGSGMTRLAAAHGPDVVLDRGDGDVARATNALLADDHHNLVSLDDSLLDR